MAAKGWRFWIGPPDRRFGRTPIRACISSSTRRAASSVDAFHAAALAAADAIMASRACADYGAENYYAEFVVDPDGYRIEAYCGAKA